MSITKKISLGIDLGDSKTGVAISNTSVLATPLRTIIEKNTKLLIEKIVAIIKEEKITTIVIGNPKNMDGSLGFRCKKVAKFVESLSNSIKENFEQTIEIVLLDERLTTVLANKNMISSGSKQKTRRQHENEEAAVIILQSYLDSKKF